MNRQQLIERMKALTDGGDTETRHVAADALLLEYIGDDELTEAFNSLKKWYA